MEQIADLKELIKKLSPELQTKVINFLEFGQEDPKEIKENGFRKFDAPPEKPEEVGKPFQKEDVMVPHYTILLEIAAKNGRKIKPLVRRYERLRTGEKYCRKCHAPEQYLRNHGFYTRKTTGERFAKHACKVCEAEYAPDAIRQSPKHKCPYCGYAMDPKRKNAIFTAYYCKNKKCDHKKLHPEGKVYASREWHLEYASINTKPEFFSGAQNRLKMNTRLLELEMMLFVEIGASTTETAKAVRRFWGARNNLTSKQTVLNHAKKLASYLIENEKYFPKVVSNIVVEDETYIRYEGKWGYLFRAIEPLSRSITAEHFSRHRDTKGCITLNKKVNEAFLTNCRDPEYILISDQAPIYLTMTDYMHQKEMAKIDHRAVKGLFNEPNEEYPEHRGEKQMVERSFGTLKSFIKRRRGFTTFAGVETFTTLHRIFYNHLRTHSELNDVPIPIHLKNGQKVANWSQIIAYIEEQKNK